jgi:hypothetical protein
MRSSIRKTIMGVNAMVKKITKVNTAPLGLYAIKALPKGEYIRRVDLCEGCAGKGLQLNPETCEHNDCSECDGKGYTKEYKTTWIKGDYCRGFGKHGKYELIDFDNMNHCQYRSGSVLVLAGFTF